MWIAEEYLHYNPFFIYGGNKDSLLHQTEVVSKSLFVKPTRLLIADVIGLGKTITALRILKSLEKYRRLGRVLIIVPSVLINQWISEMRSMGIAIDLIDRKRLEFLARHSELPTGWYIGSMDTLKQREYMEILEKGRWDAIVVDEAHKLGIVGSEPNQRWLSLGRLIRENKDAAVLLLSATPHRGKPNDYLARLALIDPTLLERASANALDKVFDKPEFYLKTHNVILFRRNKSDVNEIYERRPVFKPCVMLAVLIDPSYEERLFLKGVTELATSYLGSYYANIIDTLGWEEGRVMGIVALLRTLLIKRGLSSPRALVKTFSKLVEKRGRFAELIEKGYKPVEAQKKIAEELEEHSRRLDEILTGDIEEYEEELDVEFDRLASYFDRFLTRDFKSKLEDIKILAEQILMGKKKDSKLETLKRILRLVLKAHSEELPEEFKDLNSGKAIVFTEFKDTAYYLYENLRKWAEEEFKDPSIVRVFTSDNRDEIKDIEKWLSERGLRVLVTTDVAGEGLNLQYANVLINYEIAWSPIRLEQRIGRIWRYGQEKTSYVFNLFLADALEKEVAEVVFPKLYGISVSVGKLEPILGEKVFLSTIRNELLEHAVEGAERIGGFIPIEIEYKNVRVSLTESKIIELVTKDARAFVEAFVKALKKLVEEVKRKNIFPTSVGAKQVREELRYLTGFSDDEELANALKSIVQGISELLGFDIEDKGGIILLRSKDGTVYELLTTNSETFLDRLLTYFRVGDISSYFIYFGSEKEVMILTEVEIVVGGEVRYREPIGILTNFNTGNIYVLRGNELINKLLLLLRNSVPVDELFGLDDVLSVIPQIIDASHNTYFETVVRNGVLKVVENLKAYENIKSKLGGLNFFNVGEPQVSIKNPVFIFISSAFLPETESLPSDEVWEWAEDEAIPIVFNYEGLHGREAVRVSGFEHYDVKSVKKDSSGRVLEERFIEVKTKTRRSISIKLSSEEFKIAKEKGDKYWLYLVYGVRAVRPVILCIRNPANRLPFRRREVIKRQEDYVSEVGDWRQ